jgi:hypothetical protein
VSHAQLGLEVVSAMEAIEESLVQGGEPIELEVAPRAAVA